MAKRLTIFLLVLTAAACGCKRVTKSIEVSRSAADEFHRGAAAGLCDRFSGEMLCGMPCDTLDRVIRQTVDTVGEPKGKCRWHYTYQVVKLDPFRTVTAFKCPFEREDVKVTVVVDVTEEGTVVSGLWGDSPLIREQRLLLHVKLCGGLDENAGLCLDPIERAEWSQERICVWTEWQGLRKGDKVIMEWYSPAGVAVFDFVHDVKNEDRRSYKVWSWIEPADVDVEEPFGEWTVRIGVNGKEIEAFPVRIQPGG